MRSPASIVRALLAAAVAAGATACAGAVPADAVSVEMAHQLRAKGVAAEEVSCPTDLAAVGGAVVRCSFQVDGQPVTAVATVTQVNGSIASFRVDTEAQPVEQELLEQRIRDDVNGRGTRAAGTVDCGDDLPAAVNSSTTCTVDENWTVLVRVTGIDGGRVAYSVQEVPATS